MGSFDEIINQNENGLILPNAKYDNGIKEDTQRTAAWFESRKGRFTGSCIKELMTCDRSASKMEWGRAEKLIAFGDTAMKYVFEKAMERLRNKVIQTPTSYTMKYGTDNESTVVRLLEKIGYTIEKVGFIEIEGLEGIAGASPDGRVIDNNGMPYGLEIKCATGWDGLYNRHGIDIDQSHIDFWQLQTEMMALNIDAIMYVVAEPSENIFEPNITDLSIKIVQSSPIHQDAIRKRCLIGNDIIKEFLNGKSFMNAVRDVCSNFKPVI